MVVLKLHSYEWSNIAQPMVSPGGLPPLRAPGDGWMNRPPPGGGSRPPDLPPNRHRSATAPSPVRRQFVATSSPLRHQPVTALSPPCHHPVPDTTPSPPHHHAVIIPLRGGDKVATGWQWGGAGAVAG
eukprot:4296404-Lingulodinium_polyedra.AAC.1